MRYFLLRKRSGQTLTETLLSRIAARGGLPL
jgi:hypothetical protein